MPHSTPPSPRRHRSRRPSDPAGIPAPAPRSPSPTAAAPKPAVGFAELGVPEVLTRALADDGIHTPTPIQAAAIPDALHGRDVLGRGRTGSGKTIAFAVPTVTSLTRSDQPRRPGAPRALVLVPTRELADQVTAAIRPLATAAGLRCTTVYGGVSQPPQVRALHAGVDVLVACPGRLEDLIGQGRCSLHRVEVSVLDEADHMADLGFLPAVTRLLAQTPKESQRLLFSATLDDAVNGLARRFLVDPVDHAVNPAQATVNTMTHHVFLVAQGDKGAVVARLAGGLGRTLMFTRTKRAAKKVARQLTAAGVPAVDLHGNLTQNNRTRNLAAFAAGDVRVLVATDIAARGIHVDGIDLVVHVDPPAEHKAYLHRSGRTARAGAEGTVVTVMTPEQRADVLALTTRAGIRAQPQAVTPADPAITALTGPPAPFVEPAPPLATTPTRPGRRLRNRAGATASTGRTASAAGVSERGPRRPRSRGRRVAA